MAEKLTVQQFVNKYLDVHIFPNQKRVIDTILRGEQVMLARHGGFKTAKMVADRVRVEAAKPRRKRHSIIIFDEYADMPNPHWYRHPVKWWRWRQLWRKIGNKI